METATSLPTLVLLARMSGVSGTPPVPTPPSAPVPAVVQELPAPGTLENHLAPTPPMGWNSWNHFQCDINESVIRAQADAMAANGMKDAGYEYINIDDCWEAARRGADGRVQVDAARFPGGMKALADYVHSKGLKLGIYTDAGSKTCQGRPGSKGYERQDAQSYAGWGIDYVKEDWCYTEKTQDPKASYVRMASALLKTGRPIVLSLCDWGYKNPWEWGAEAGGNLWRTTGDIAPKFSSVLGILDKQAPLAPYARPGHWNDPDMLEVGNGMTPDEDRAHFSLWAILAAPLIAGNDLANMPERTKAVLTAPEVIAVDQDPAGIEGTRLWKNGDLEVWARPLQQKGARAVVLFNRGETAASIRVDWRTLGLKPGDAAVRDLWARQDLGVRADAFEAGVRPHSAVMVKIVGSAAH